MKHLIVNYQGGFGKSKLTAAANLVKRFECWPLVGPGGL